MAGRQIIMVNECGLPEVNDCRERRWRRKREWQRSRPFCITSWGPRREDDLLLQIASQVPKGLVRGSGC